MSLTVNQSFAVKLHNHRCPDWKSGTKKARCPCGFIIKPKHQPAWFKNHPNQIFLKRAKLAIHIMNLESVSEEDILDNYEYYKVSYYTSHPENITK